MIKYIISLFESHKEQNYNLIKNIILNIERHKEINKEKKYEYKGKNYLILENDFYYKNKPYYLLNIKSQNDENMENIGLQFVYIFNEPDVITTVSPYNTIFFKIIARHQI